MNIAGLPCHQARCRGGPGRRAHLHLRCPAIPEPAPVRGIRDASAQVQVLCAGYQATPAKDRLERPGINQWPDATLSSPFSRGATR